MTESGGVPAFFSEPFDVARHLTDGFRCGEPELDEWLQRQARHAGLMNRARTFVWVRPGGSPAPVLAYYALSAHLIASEDAPKRVSRGRPRQLPAVLLAKLALSQELRAQGLGAQMLVDALRRAVAASRRGPAARVIVVDALHEQAAQFYLNFGFSAVPAHPLRLVRTMSDVESAVAPAS